MTLAGCATLVIMMMMMMIFKYVHVMYALRILSIRYDV